MSELFNQIKAAKSEVFRRAFIKRRRLSDGLYESDWFEITDDVKSWGKITTQVDAIRRFKFTFGGCKLVMNNDIGLYNPADSDTSLWNGYLNQQRTLVRIDVGYVKRTQRSDGVWFNTYYPQGAVWDVDLWDAPESEWSGSGSTVFMGYISGDIPLSDKNEVTLPAKPLNSCFQDYPAQYLRGWTSTGMTASQFVTMLRDQTDGAGQYVFRPFFGDTTTNWDISTTSNVFSNLNTSTAADVFDRSVLDILETLAEAENFVPYVSSSGVMKFVSRDSASTTTVFEFHGAGSYSGTYGQTIKKVNSFSDRITKYYSRVQVKFRAEDTTTSYQVVESALTVSPLSGPWVLGPKTLEIENLYIPTSTVAATIAQTVFNDVSSLKKEIDFETTLVPQLDLFDVFGIYYDPNEFSQDNLWDQNNWAPATGSGDDDLVWDKSAGDAIVLSGEQFRFLSLEIDLDNFSNRFVAREL